LIQTFIAIYITLAFFTSIWIALTEPDACWEENAGRFALWSAAWPVYVLFRVFLVVFSIVEIASSYYLLFIWKILGIKHA